MREIKEIVQRNPFEDYEVFETSPAVLKSTTDLSALADNEIIHNNEGLFIRKGNELIPLSSGTTKTVQTIYRSSGSNSSPALNGNVSKWDEPLTGDCNGANDTFTLPSNYVPNSLKALFRSGVRQSVSIDYTISGITVTFLAGKIPETGDTVRGDYEIS